MQRGAKKKKGAPRKKEKRQKKSEQLASFGSLCKLYPLLV